MPRPIAILAALAISAGSVAHAEPRRETTYRCPKTKNREQLQTLQAGTLSKKKGNATIYGVYVNCIYQTEGNRSQKQIWCEEGEDTAEPRQKPQDDGHTAIEVWCS